MKATPHILILVLALAFSACAKRQAATHDLALASPPALPPAVTPAAPKPVAPPAEGDRGNVALHKTVETNLAAPAISPPTHLVDGNLRTQAANRASRLDFQVDLCRFDDSRLKPPAAQAYAIDEIVIHWSMYGAQFRGAPDAKSRPRTPEPYVVRYKLEYLDDDASAGMWTVLHTCATSPEKERAHNVKVDVQRNEKSQYTGYVTTRIQDLNLRGVRQLRLTATSGMHWIGCYEFEAYGVPEKTDT